MTFPVFPSGTDFVVGNSKNVWQADGGDSPSYSHVYATRQAKGRVTSRRFAKTEVTVVPEGEVAISPKGGYMWNAAKAAAEIAEHEAKYGEKLESPKAVFLAEQARDEAAATERYNARRRATRRTTDFSELSEDFPGEIKVTFNNTYGNASVVMSMNEHELRLMVEAGQAFLQQQQYRSDEEFNEAHGLVE